MTEENKEAITPFTKKEDVTLNGYLKWTILDMHGRVRGYSVDGIYLIELFASPEYGWCGMLYVSYEQNPRITLSIMGPSAVPLQKAMAFAVDRYIGPYFRELAVLEKAKEGMINE